tara:strand:+ start:1578 stop:2315 length:738 start_codon:yes stop_codon:yes gene_type:complete
MKLISIIIPYFKKKKFIKQTIKSLLDQKYKKFEILIIYDDTEKKDLHLIKEIVASDKRIRLIVNKKNIGAGKSRNKAMGMARGDFIAFIDSDDIWHPNKLMVQSNFMIRKKISLSHTSYNIIDENNNKIGFRRAEKISFIKLKKSCDIGLSTVMLKKNVIKKNQLFADLKTKEDFVFWLRLTKRNYDFYPIRKPLTSWRDVKSSLSSSIIQKLFNAYSVYRFYLRENVLKAVFSTIILSLNFLRK